MALVPSSVRHLHPEEVVWEAMMTGWAAQMRSRALSVSTVEPRLSGVRRFMTFSGEYPWRWSPDDVDAWSAELLGRRVARSTLRGYQAGLRLFCDYLVDARYGWGERCLELFGTHPVQVCHEWNTMRHVVDVEARPAVRPLTREEVQRLFDHADDQVEAVRRLGRKGWQAAWRDAALFKVIYGFGLRRREAVMLDTVDFHRNAVAPEFGAFAICQVRYGKAMRGSPPRRRSVLGAWPWTTTVLAEYVEQIRPLYATARGPALWPTERGGRVSVDYVTRRFAEYRDAAGLPAELHPHCLRHSYVTHLIEDGWDPTFVQHQVGHIWGSTTALYSGVSGDFKNQTLRATLDRLTGGGS
ncbi:site-specific recombinase XerD [Friedmanniella antarctica]|uniref:Site-specific recombinase XerD n=1 Tax=Microlunatus antarcticus TaxID=53388 RepID=A0A7W5P6F6_9ACTN|nr:tyrosine-type recombinase/integrase [Microlunatus antarcticus]MBB3326464.1 site-specific recombinase XerD [Microlunatus antarcticus]